MEHPYIEEHHIVDRYLMGHLDADEAEAFQDHTMSCPECLDDLTMAEAMHQGMRDAFAGMAGRAATPVGRRPWYTQGWLSAAAVLVLAVAAGVMALKTMRSDAWIAQLQDDLATMSSPSANVPIVRMSPERRAVPDGREPSWIVSTAGSQWLVLALATGMPNGGPYEGRIYRTGIEPIWRESGITADSTGEVTIGLHAAHLPPGDYHLTLEERQPDRPAHLAARYYFRVGTSASE